MLKRSLCICVLAQIWKYSYALLNDGEYILINAPLGNYVSGKTSHNAFPQANWYKQRYTPGIYLDYMV